ncbi:MAG TPA: glycosyltransferase family 1 protein [Candidatus Saccharimonadales bacterium]|nr:glycosyltransferase family 1 protein [Candidatus Saccharimonadales bacterium]
MKIVIDARTGFGTGIGRYAFNLIEQLQQIDHRNQYHILMLPKDFDKWQPLAPNFHKHLAHYPFYSWREQLLLPILLYRLKPDLVHFTAFNAPLAYFGRYVVTIHDLTLVYFKNIRGSGVRCWVYAVKYWAMRLVLRHAIMVSRAVITPTEFVRNQLIARYQRDRFPVPPAKVTATLEAVDVALSANRSNSAQPKAPFLLYVGNAYPHKNLDRLVEAFALVRLRHSDLALAIVGQEDYFYQQLRHKVRAANLESCVTFPGYLNDSELAALYRQTKLFVFPSLSEGFGLPPLEAMAQGAAVIASNASCLPEVCGDAAAYFDPTDPTDMANKISALLDNPAELARLKQAGPQHVKSFSWRRMAEQTLAVYNQRKN